MSVGGLVTIGVERIAEYEAAGRLDRGGESWRFANDGLVRVYEVVGFDPDEGVYRLRVLVEERTSTDPWELP